MNKKYKLTNENNNVSVEEWNDNEYLDKKICVDNNGTDDKPWLIINFDTKEQIGLFDYNSLVLFIDTRDDNTVFILSNISDENIKLIVSSLKDLSRPRRIKKMEECNHFDYPQLYLYSENDHDYHKPRIDVHTYCLECGNPMVIAPYRYNLSELIGYDNELNEFLKELPRVEQYDILVKRYNEFKTLHLDKQTMLDNLKAEFENTELIRERK